MSIQEFSAAANPEEDVGTIPRISRRLNVFFLRGSNNFKNYCIPLVNMCLLCNTKINVIVLDKLKNE
jgi:hypothetical protein